MWTSSSSCSTCCSIATIKAEIQKPLCIALEDTFPGLISRKRKREEESPSPEVLSPFSSDSSSSSSPRSTPSPFSGTLSLFGNFSFEDKSVKEKKDKDANKETDKKVDKENESSPKRQKMTSSNT